jgi:DNA-binding transcriptional LysR family regulator
MAVSLVVRLAEETLVRQQLHRKINSRTGSVQNSTESSLNWEDVRYFLELARLGSLSAAARSLEVEHSTVGRRVDALEQTLKVRLFDRLPRGWQLTTEGEQLLTHAERLEEEALAFERAAVGVGKLGGVVRVSVPPSLGSLVLVPRLAALRDRWNGIILEVIGDARQADLSRREADLSVRLGRPEAPGLAARSLGQIGNGLFGTADYLKLPEESWEFVAFDDSLGRVPHQLWLQDYKAGRPYALRSNDQLAIAKAIAAGVGVGCLPYYIARDTPGLVEIQPPTPIPGREIWLVLHPDVRRSPRVRLVADLIADVVLGAAEVLGGGT